MSLLDQILESRYNPELAGRIADKLRLKFGYDYQNTFTLFRKMLGEDFDEGEFEELMYEAKNLEN